MVRHRQSVGKRSKKPDYNAFCKYLFIDIENFCTKAWINRLILFNQSKYKHTDLYLFYKFCHLIIGFRTREINFFCGFYGYTSCSAGLWSKGMCLKMHTVYRIIFAPLFSPFYSCKRSPPPVLRSARQLKYYIWCMLFYN